MRPVGVFVVFCLVFLASSGVQSDAVGRRINTSVADPCGSVPAPIAPVPPAISGLDGIVPPPDSTATEVGQAGAVVVSPDGLVSVQIDQGAVAEPVTLQISGHAVDPARDAFTAYEFDLLAALSSDDTPVDSVTTPITLTLSIPQVVADSLGSDLSRMSVLHFSKGGYWRALDTSFDDTSLTVTATSADLGLFALAADPQLETTVDQEIVYPLEGGIVEFESGAIKLTFTDGDISERLSVTLDVKDACEEHPAPRDVLMELELTAAAIDRDDAPVTDFNQPVDLEINHPLEQMIPYAPESLRLYRLDESSGEWVEVPAQIDPSMGLVQAELDHFSTYSTQAESDIVFPPGNLHFQVNMQSGAASASIPIALPPGPGGFGPSLSLNYASSAVDEMKTAKTMAGWVGAGWNLSVPHVSRDPFATEVGCPSACSYVARYFLSMNGVSDLLVRENTPISGQTYRFHTKRESHLDIQGRLCKSGVETYYNFTVRTKDGTTYRFGNIDPNNCTGSDGTNFFSRYISGGWKEIVYRINVKRTTDARGNYADYSYWEDVVPDCFTTPCYNYDRAAYPSTIQWGANSSGGGHVYKVTLSRGSDWDVAQQCGNPNLGQVRTDAPIDGGNPGGSGCPPGTCSNFVPHVMDTRYLTNILVETIAGADIRSYDFDYNHIPRGYSGNCPVSRALEFDTLTERGKNGTFFRTMDFGYENHAVRWETSGGSLCTSNNDGALSRPYLNSFKNGFGGETTFAYDEKWAAASGSSCGWSRWVVDERVLVPGAGQPPQTYGYSYSGLTYGPNDSPNGISSVGDVEFRGFSFVTEDQPSGGNDRMECDFRVGEYDTGLVDECRWFTGSQLERQITNTYGQTSTCTTDCDEWETETRFEESWFVHLDRTTETLTGRDNSEISYTYDGYGNVKRICEYLNPGAPSAPCASGWDRRTDHVYAENASLYIVGLPRQTQVSDGSEILQQQFFYDNLGFGSVNEGLVTRIETLKDSGEIVQNFGYDNYGNQTSSSDGVRTTTINHTACSNTQVASTSLGGKTTSYSYGDCVLALPETITTPDGVVQNIRYDDFGRVEREWLPGESQTTPTVDYDYEWNATLPNSTTVKHRDGSAGSGYLEDRHFVDGFGRAIQVRSEISCSSTASVVDIAYNNAGYKASESIPYPSSGCSTYTPPATVNKTSHEYDALGRVTKVTNPDGSFRRIEYNSTSVRYTNERLYCTDHLIDSFGRITTVREFKQVGCSQVVDTDYTYDVRDNLTVIRDAATNTTFIDYDRAGWKKSLDDPDTGLWTYTYYDDGQLKTQTDQRGITTEFFYDGLGRIQRKEFLSGGSNIAPDVTYTYDNCQMELSPCGAINGHLTKVVEWAETILYDYDSRARLAQERHQIAGQNYDVSYTYDSMDRLTQTVYPDIEAVNRTYNPQGLTETVSSFLGDYLRTGTTYNAAGQPTALKLSSVLTLQYTYRSSDLRLLTSTVNTGLMNVTYGYDGVGNITSVSDGVEGSNVSFGYDWADRLQTVSGMPGGSVGYGYNDIGNFTVKNEGAITFSNFNYGAGSAGPHAVTSVLGASGNFHTYEYDEIGNLLREKVDGRVIHEFNYDPAGHVFARRSEPFDIGGADYYYNNSDGTLVRKVAHGEGIFVYVGDIYERDLASGEVTKYYFAEGQRIAMRKGTSLYYFATDHLGGTSVVMNASGGLVNRVRYYPYGGVRDEDYGSGASELVTDRLFTGQQRQAGSTIYHYGARLYNTATGRFVQADPIVGTGHDPPLLNRYAYVRNNPLRYSDPSGMCVPDMNCPGDPGRAGYTLPQSGLPPLAPYGQPIAGPAPAPGGGVHCGGYSCYPWWKFPGGGGGSDFLLAYFVGCGAATVFGVGLACDVTDPFVTAGMCLFAECTMLDIFGAAFPGLNAGGSRLATRTAQFADDAATARRTLRRNLENAGYTRQPGSETHHIVPIKDTRAEDARAVLQKYDVDINEAANGVFLPSSVHYTTRRNAYFKTLDSSLANARSRDEVLEILDDIRYQLQTGGVP